MRCKGTSSFQPLLLTWDTLIQSSLVIHGGLTPSDAQYLHVIDICVWLWQDVPLSLHSRGFSIVLGVWLIQILLIGTFWDFFPSIYF